MLEVGTNVRVAETTGYDAPEFTTESPFWDGSLFGGKTGTVVAVVEEGEIFDAFGTLFRVSVPGLPLTESGEDWLFPLEELEVI